jgi:hypothetical protein
MLPLTQTRVAWPEGTLIIRPILAPQLSVPWFKMLCPVKLVPVAGVPELTSLAREKVLKRIRYPVAAARSRESVLPGQYQSQP